MKQKTEVKVKKNAVNFFGSFGYLFCFLQWFWVVMLYFSVIQSMVLLITSNMDRPVEQSSRFIFIFRLPGSLEILILAIVVVVMVVITIYIFIKVPISVVKTGNKFVHKTAETIAPRVIESQHKKDTKKFRDKITAELILFIKALVIVIPVVLTVTSGLLEKQSIDYSIAMTIGEALACCSAVFFVIQYVLAVLLRVELSNIW